MENRLGQEPKNQSDKLFDKKFIIYFISGLIVIVVIFIVSAIYFRNFDQYSFWPNVVGAAVGVILTAMVTGLLLWGQTKAEESIRKRQREADQASERATREFQEEQKNQDRTFQVELNKQQSDFQKLLLDKDNEDKRYLEIHNAKLRVYADFVSKMYEIFSDSKVTKKEFIKLRIQLFGQVIFYANDNVLYEIEKQLNCIDNPQQQRDQAKFPKVFSSITSILRKDLFKKSTDVEIVTDNNSVMNLWNEFERIISLYKDDMSDENEETEKHDSQLLTGENETPICINNTFWHFAMWGGEQLKALSQGINELNLVEYEEEWRTNLMKQVSKDDLIFLFRSGGPGYMGVFRALGWRIFEFKDNNIVTEKRYIFGESVIQITDNNEINKDLARSDIYNSRKDGATLCSSLIVEPLAFARNGIGNPGGVYRRTISRYDHGYGLMQLARYMAIMDNDNIYNIYIEDGKKYSMGCNKERFNQILMSGNIQKAERHENGEWK